MGQSFIVFETCIKKTCVLSAQFRELVMQKPLTGAKTEKVGLNSPGSYRFDQFRQEIRPLLPHRPPDKREEGTGSVKSELSAERLLVRPLPPFPTTYRIVFFDHRVGFRVPDLHINSIEDPRHLLLLHPEQVLQPVTEIHQLT